MSDSPRPIPAIQQRVIRVFVSSTFRDMHAEREELVKHVFPKLRKLCEARGVTWGEVDLRWGVTDEQKAEGKVLPICLAEIDKSRPYFIGLLGERYGWMPEEIDPALIEREPWLAEHRDRSVTELEILHGVLNNPAMADHAVFYFRSPAFAETLPAEQWPAFREEPSAEEIEQHGPEEAKYRAEDRRQKLAVLKERIRASGLPVHDDYRDPQKLGELVLRDLTAVIDRLYPEGSQLDPLDREANDHEAFAASRARVYIGRREYFDRLDAHVQGDEPPLVVLGESGSGKSALLANWALRYRASLPEQQPILHFIGASPASADWAAILRRIMGEFQRRFDLQLEIPDQPDALRLAFANALHMAAARGRVVLILDALTQLEDRDGAPDLVWLPPAIPLNVRLIISTLPGRPLEELARRGWPTLTVEPLETDERKRLIVDYLAQYTKALSPAQAEDIAAAEQAANPLYLRALLEELRLYGDHYTLNQRIEHYLAAATVADLYEKVLERYEEDYERDRPGLVRDSMSLLWAARRGLSEVELLELLGTDGEPLPSAHWSPLYLAAEQALVSRSGLIGFFHDYLRQAVRDRYLPDEGAQQAAHLRLADYFEKIDLGSRKVDELPWHLAQAQAWPRLYDLLADLAFFSAAWNANQFEVKAHWALVELNSALRMVDAYRAVLDSPGQFAESHVWGVAMVLADMGHAEEAILAQRYLVEQYRQTGDFANLQRSLGNEATILAHLGELDSAMALLREQQRLCRELDIKGDLEASLGNQAIILSDLGQLDASMELLKEQERLCRELDIKGDLGACLNTRAGILRDRGELDASMALLKEQERLCRELSNKASLATSLDIQALILRDRGELSDAMALHKEEEEICRSLGDKYGLQACLSNQAAILWALGEPHGAMALLRKEEEICRSLGDRYGLQGCLGNQAVILFERDDLDGAMTLFREQERLCRELRNKHGLRASLGNQAGILRARGELGDAMALHKEEEEICREMGNKAGTATSLVNQASILAEDMAQPERALPLAAEAYRLATEHGLTALAQQIKPILDYVRSRAG